MLLCILSQGVERVSQTTLSNELERGALDPVHHLDLTCTGSNQNNDTKVQTVTYLFRPPRQSKLLFEGLAELQTRPYVQAFLFSLLKEWQTYPTNNFIETWNYVAHSVGSQKR